MVFMIIVYQGFSLNTTYWATPIELLHIPDSELDTVSSLFYDPVSRVTHIVFSDNPNYRYYYFGVSEKGEFYQTSFRSDLKSQLGLLCGPKDGKNIYLILNMGYDGKYAISFTESNDNGKTWGSPIRITGSDQSYVLNDVIYIQETGRIFAFYYASLGTMRVISRPPGSSIFSQEIKIANANCLNGAYVARATYSITHNNMIILHLFYRDPTSTMSYVKSLDNGITWSAPKRIISDQIGSVFHSSSDSKITGKVFATFGYNCNDKPAQMIVTDNNSESFSSPIQLTRENVDGSWRSHGFKIFGSFDKPMLATLFTTVSGYGEYRIWDLETMSYTNDSHPFCEPYIRGPAMDIVYGNQQKSEYLVKVAVIKVKSAANERSFQFSKGKIELDEE